MIETSGNTNREELLDIARVVACLSIMLFHFYSRHTTGIEAYPYGDSYDFFRYGYLGVPFFFMLSGYLILPSLQRASSLYSFLVKKIIRLWIPLVLCSVVTFIFVLLVDTDMIYASAHKLSNFIFSLLFIHPYWATTLTGHEFDYINGAYWFLSVEIIFIILSACIYYIDKIHFVRNFLLLSIVGHLVFYGIYYGGHRIITNYFCNNKLGIPFEKNTMLLARDWLYSWTYPVNSIYCLFGFIICLWKNRLNKSLTFKKSTLIALSAIWLILFGVQCILFKPSLPEQLIVLVICMVFTIYLSIYRRALLSRIVHFLCRLGKTTYSTYLIHETIGVIIIHRYAAYFGRLGWMLPLVLIILAYVFGWISYYIVEQPVTKNLINIIYNL